MTARRRPQQRMAHEGQQRRWDATLRPRCHRQIPHAASSASMNFAVSGQQSMGMPPPISLTVGRHVGLDVPDALHLPRLWVAKSR